MAAWAAALVWALALMAAFFWGLKLWGSGPLVSVDGLPRSAPVADVAAVARALGAGSVPPAEVPPPAAEAAQFRLIGVVAHRDRWGAALIEVRGQAPRPYQVGAELAPGWVLQSVDRRSVRLGPARTGPAMLTLELPPERD